MNGWEETMMRTTVGLFFFVAGSACSGEESENVADTEDTLEACTDGIDNDGDLNPIDCRDEDCRPFAEDCALPLAKPDGSPAVLTGCEPLPDPGVGTVTTVFYAEDFEDERRVDLGFTIDLYFDNAYHGDTADATATAAAGETLTGAVSVPNRVPIAYRFRAIEGEFRETIEYDVLTPGADGEEMRAVTVKESTYAVIPASLGIRIESGKGIIAGNFTDCEGDEVANVLASVVPDDPGIQIRYFIDEFPNRQPVTTTEDGLWGAMNVPPGAVTVEFRGRTTDGGPIELIGSHDAVVVEDSINIIDVAPLGN